jgi:hypothetical protein
MLRKLFELLRSLFSKKLRSVESEKKFWAAEGEPVDKPCPDCNDKRGLEPHYYTEGAKQKSALICSACGRAFSVA